MLTSALATDVPAPAESPSTRLVYLKSKPELGGGDTKGLAEGATIALDDPITAKGRPSVECQLCRCLRSSLLALTQADGASCAPDRAPLPQRSALPPRR